MSFVGGVSRTQTVACDCLPGYRLVECLGRSPLAETWRAESPDGHLRAVKYVYAAARHGVLGATHARSSGRLLEMVHPGLARVHEVANDQGRLVFVTELGAYTLRDLYDDALDQGRSGLMRTTLLDALEPIASGLDYLAREHVIHHLSLNPRSIIFVDEQPRLADFGIVELLWIPAGQDVARLNPRYAAPELFEGRFNVATDQFALALIYVEMLTGNLPHRGQTSRQLAEQRRREELVLDEVPGPDRRIIAKALRYEPRRRFATCLEFVQALRANRAEARGGNAEIEASRRHAQRPALPPPTRRDAQELSTEELIRRLVRSVATPGEAQESHGYRYHVGDDAQLEHRCAAWLPDGVAQHKLDGLVHRWQAEVVRNEPNELELAVDLTRGFWQRVFRGRRRLQLLLRLNPAKTGEARLTEVHLTMTIGRRKQDRALLHQVAPVLLDDLHHLLLATPERRGDDRYPFERQFSVAPLYCNAAAGAPVACEGKDISHSGIGFIATTPPETKQIYVYQASTTESFPFAIPAAVTRVQRLDDGRYLAGARFITESEESP